MNNVISKELLSEVLGNGIYTHVSLDNCVVSWNNAKEDESINIHELAHECKEWAYRNGYILSPWKRDMEWYGCEVRDITSEDIIMINGKTYTRSKLEPEAIFKACQWILDNKEQIC